MEENGRYSGEYRTSNFVLGNETRHSGVLMSNLRVIPYSHLLLVIVDNLTIWSFIVHPDFVRRCWVPTLASTIKMVPDSASTQFCGGFTPALLRTHPHNMFYFSTVERGKCPPSVCGHRTKLVPFQQSIQFVLAPIALSSL